LGLIVLGVAQSTELVFLCILFFLFSEYTMPSLRSMLSKTVDINEKGKAFAFLASLQNVCFFTGGLIFYSIYNSSHGSLPGLSFHIVAGLESVAVLILLYIHWRLPQERSHHLDQLPVLEEAVEASNSSSEN
jgi:MFS family permease